MRVSASASTAAEPPLNDREAKQIEEVVRAEYDKVVSLLNGKITAQTDALREAESTAQRMGSDMDRVAWERDRLAQELRAAEITIQRLEERLGDQSAKFMQEHEQAKRMENAARMAAAEAGEERRREEKLEEERRRLMHRVQEMESAHRTMEQELRQAHDAARRSAEQTEALRAELKEAHRRGEAVVLQSRQMTERMQRDGQLAVDSLRREMEKEVGRLGEEAARAFEVARGKEMECEAVKQHAHLLEQQVGGSRHKIEEMSRLLVDTAGMMQASIHEPPSAGLSRSSSRFGRSSLGAPPPPSSIRAGPSGLLSILDTPSNPVVTSSSRLSVTGTSPAKTTSNMIGTPGARQAFA